MSVYIIFYIERPLLPEICLIPFERGKRPSIPQYCNRMGNVGGQKCSGVLYHRQLTRGRENYAAK